MIILDRILNRLVRVRKYKCSVCGELIMEHSNIAWMGKGVYHRDCKAREVRKMLGCFRIEESTIGAG